MPSITISGYTFAVLADQADAARYFAGRLNGTTWTALTSDTKDVALVDASNLLRQRTWRGDPATPGQDLPFPRTGLLDRNGDDVSSTTIPQDVINGTCELALALVLNADKVRSGAQGTASNVKAISAVSGTSVEFFGAVAGTRLPTAVNDWLAPYLEDGTTGGTGASVGGAATFGSEVEPQLEGLGTLYTVGG